METEVQQFQSEANEKSVDELVHLERVKDLLAELQKQVPEYTPPPPALNWAYGKGPDGPANWANLSPDFQLCSDGKAQSPINIELDLTAAELPSLGWQLPGETPFKVKANKGSSVLTGREFYDGHTFEVDDLGEPVMTVDGTDYVLEEFHFHTPSEHAVAGRHYDAEIQFVHVEKGKEGSNDPSARRLIAAAFFQKVWDSMCRFHFSPRLTIILLAGREVACLYRAAGNRCNPQSNSRSPRTGRAEFRGDETFFKYSWLWRMTNTLRSPSPRPSWSGASRPAPKRPRNSCQTSRTISR